MEDSGGVRTGDPAVLAVGGRERAVTLWTWDGSRTSLRATMALPRAPPHASEPHRGRLRLAFAWCRPGADGADGADGHDVAWLVTASHAGELLRWTVRVGDLRGDAPAPAPAVPERVGDADASHRKVVFSVVVRNGTAMTTSWIEPSHSGTSGCVVGCGRWRVWVVFAYAVSPKPEDPFAVAVACGDGTVRAADPRIGFEPTTSEAHASDSDNVLWRGLVQTKTTCMAWYPRGRRRGLLTPRAGSFVVHRFGRRPRRSTSTHAVGDAGRYDPVQRDCHGGPVTRAQWVIRSRGVSNAPPVRELVTLGDGRAWRWTEFASPGGGVRARPGSGSGPGGGGFVDVTMRFHDADTTGEMTTFEFTDDGAFVAVGWSDGSVTTHRRDDSDECRTLSRSRRRGARRSLKARHRREMAPGRDRRELAAAVRMGQGDVRGRRVHGVRPGGTRGSIRAEMSPGSSSTSWRPPSGQSAGVPLGRIGDVPDARAGRSRGDAVAATAGADGLARVWNVANAPALVAVMRGHEGRVLCLCWTRPGALSRGGSRRCSPVRTTRRFRRWDPDDPEALTRGGARRRRVRKRARSAPSFRTRTRTNERKPTRR